MNTWKTVIESLALLLIAAQLCWANPNNEPSRRRDATVTLMPCALPTSDMMDRLPWFVKASDVVCVSITADDLKASEETRMLLMDVGSRLQNENRFSRVQSEYDLGMAAYGKGNYTEAISHLRAVAR